MQHHGQVLEKDDLMEMLWPDSDVEESNLPQHISALRKTLGEGPNEEFTDIFKIEDSISGRVAEHLVLKLTGERESFWSSIIPITLKPISYI